MTTRCKFKCDSVLVTENGMTIKMVPVTCGSKENESFYRWTPSGELTLGVVNQEHAKLFVPGKQYYLDITEAAS